MVWDVRLLKMRLLDVCARCRSYRRGVLVGMLMLMLMLMLVLVTWVRRGRRRRWRRAWAILRHYLEVLDMRNLDIPFGEALA